MAALLAVLSVCGIQIAAGSSAGVLVGILGVPGVKGLLKSGVLAFLKTVNKPMTSTERVCVFRNLHPGYGVWDNARRGYVDPMSVTEDMVKAEPNRFRVCSPTLPSLR